MKQAIVVRTDLKMGKGKIASQCSHASIASYKNADKKKVEQWEEEGMKKVVLKIDSKKELLELHRKCKKMKIACAMIKDAGKTQIKSDITALGIGPDTDNKIDNITGKLKLL